MENNLWVVGEGKWGQLGLGKEILSCNQLTKLPPIIKNLPDRKEGQRSMTLTRNSPPNLNKEERGPRYFATNPTNTDSSKTLTRKNSWNRISSSYSQSNTFDDTIVSIHCGPISCACITSIYFLDSYNF